MIKDIEGHKVCYILLAEDQRGCIILCEQFDDWKKVMGAYNVVHAPSVCVFRQDCNTTILVHKEESHGNNKTT